MAQKKIDLSLTIVEAEHAVKAIEDAQHMHVVAHDRENPALNRALKKLTKEIDLFKSADLDPVKGADGAGG